MPRSHALASLNSTNVRFIAGLGARRLALRASSAVTPELAGLWAERLFLTPPRPRTPASELFGVINARAGGIEHRGRRLAVWRWGEPDAPAVLLAHGWGGRALQLQAFVQPLLKAGYRVIGYDQPAHGLSQGRLTGLPDMADALATVAGVEGGVHAVIAHSLGATGAALAAAQGLPVERVVMVSPPSDMVGYSRRFARWHWMPERIRSAMQSAIEERYGLRWSELELARIAPRLKPAALVIHDREDRMVPAKQGVRFARAWQGARLLRTAGLGHGRILTDPAVIDAAVDFVRGGTGGAGVAGLEHPIPAPIY
jgi:pimeloyl-ACP methyl ester carboxylesterase